MRYRYLFFIEFNYYKITLQFKCSEKNSFLDRTKYDEQKKLNLKEIYLKILDFNKGYLISLGYLCC